MNEIEALRNILSNEYITESVGDITLYHGDTDKFNLLKPMGIDFGNAFQKKGWSIFCFKTESEATGWAAFKAIKDKVVKYVRNAYPEISCAYHPVLHKYFADENSYNLIKDYLVKNGGIDGWVYSIKVPFYKVGLGNDSAHREYTYRHEIKPKSRTKIHITANNLSDYCTAFPSADRDREMLKLQHSVIGRRGFESIFMTNDYSYQYVSNKDIIRQCFKSPDRPTYGDDIEKYFLDHNMKIDKLYPFKRLMISLKE